MKRVIFTCYDDLNDQTDKWNLFSFQQNQIKDYFDRLIQNKKDYAEHICAHFIFYHNEMSKYVHNDIGLEFTKANLYKHELMAKLAEEYDEVMYVDMDVVFNTDKNVFEELDLSKGIYIQHQDDDIKSKVNEENLLQELGMRSPTLKYHITKDLLGGKDCHVMNTGIMIGRSEYIKQIKFSDRLPSIIEKIKAIETTSFLRMYYYPNNESIFSYILEEYNIPYVLMEEQWHTIIDDRPKHIDLDKVEIAHFTNKKFNMFFNDKTKCVFSIYVDIPEERLDNPGTPRDDTVNKSKRTKDRLAKYKDNLIDNHQAYADRVGAEYILFERDDEYEEFYKKFPDLSEYDVINLYKCYQLDKLSKEYDLVLYVDLDVYFVDNCVDAFNYLRAEHSFACQSASREFLQITENTSYWLSYERDFRSPHAKYWNAHALLIEEGFKGDNNVFNTGIMMASKKVMEQINYFGDIDEVIETMKQIKIDSMYPENVRKSFGFDNETIMGYKVIKNNVPVHNIGLEFHWKHDYGKLASYDKTTEEFKIAKNVLASKIRENNVQMIHFISKNFGLVFE